MPGSALPESPCHCPSGGARLPVALAGFRRRWFSLDLFEVDLGSQEEGGGRYRPSNVEGRIRRHRPQDWRRNPRGRVGGTDRRHVQPGAFGAVLAGLSVSAAAGAVDSASVLQLGSGTSLLSDLPRPRCPAPLPRRSSPPVGRPVYRGPAHAGGGRGRFGGVVVSASWTRPSGTPDPGPWLTPLWPVAVHGGSVGDSSVISRNQSQSLHSGGGSCRCNQGRDSGTRAAHFRSHRSVTDRSPTTALSHTKRTVAASLRSVATARRTFRSTVPPSRSGQGARCAHFVQHISGIQHISTQ